MRVTLHACIMDTRKCAWRRTQQQPQLPILGGLAHCCQYVRHQRLFSTACIYERVVVFLGEPDEVDVRGRPASRVSAPAPLAFWMPCARSK